MMAHAILGLKRQKWRPGSSTKNFCLASAMLFVFACLRQKETNKQIKNKQIQTKNNVHYLYDAYRSSLTT